MSFSRGSLAGAPFHHTIGPAEPALLPSIIPGRSPGPDRIQITYTSPYRSPRPVQARTGHQGPYKPVQVTKAGHRLHDWGLCPNHKGHPTRCYLRVFVRDFLSLSLTSGLWRYFFKYSLWRSLTSGLWLYFLLYFLTRSITSGLR